VTAAVLALLLAASQPGFPRRIVALAPGCAEIAGALGLGDRLVGVTDFTDWPPRVKELPKVGSYVSFSVEAVAALEPDLVLATDDGNPGPALRRLAALGIRVETLHLSGWRAIEREIQRLGGVLGRPAEAGRAVEDMERTARCVSRRVAGVRRPRVLLAYEMAPIVSAGAGTFTDEMLALAGGESVTHDVKVPYPRLSAEEILARAPDVVIVSSMNPSLDVNRWQEWIARWPAIPAVAKGRVHVLDSTNLDRPSQRSALGLLLLARTLHPSLFANGECAPGP
jgi:iron complex transport system substrate-binding protein